MTSLSLIDGTRHLEAIALECLAERFGTPLYVYSRAALTANYQAFDEAFAEVEHQVCFAVKANSNIAVLNVLARLGAGFDIVSGGELERVIAAGGEPSKIVFSGLGKTEVEIQRALELGIACFNVESEAELDRINAVAARLKVKAPISLRVNPDVDAQTHPYISTGLKENKFGVAIERAPEVYRRAIALGHLDAVGIDCHIGSQLTSTAPFSDALDRVLAMIDQLADEGITLSHIDIGGGLGVRYKDETPPTPAEYAAALLPRLKARGLKVYMEPGRAIAANAGVLLTRVEFVKPTEHKHFAIVDAAMNDLIRPALYQAWMDIVPVTPRTEVTSQRYDVVGAVCETGDFLGKDRDLSITAGDLLAVTGAGAYGFVMSSNYNTRGRAAEIIVDGDQAWQVRRRETTADLLALESLLP
ncbi:diaminopimelate decarboxylase [Paraperlucidibaca wandonensis]|jgi:diaminopimelate decarboxylase|uniref:Diaminopimelate decarboxylase n=1 Tax=Paraperlucidibaca wandonensis TaxID=1268273 RepID=A0ABW3HGZ7_9GAMM|nr:diaminopimelate decarboxylase [Paraperlucidibaca sp.]MBQ0722984.1 diaminopimelate decarboxylase [Paraperlucidibaca sp.]MBQ0842444.1 diaminopimelate decarboxylase [Paraperlucidibaca sp.]|tara:strand:+ start:3129 stop:4376 length:1248 start_codon:yes stop_codon:yes gene_type:complete